MCVCAPRRRGLFPTTTKQRRDGKSTKASSLKTQESTMVERPRKSGAVKEGPRACRPRGHVRQRAGVSWSVAPSQMQHLRFGVLASRRRAYRGSWINFCDDHIVQRRQRRQCRQCRQRTSLCVCLSLSLGRVQPAAGLPTAPGTCCWQHACIGAASQQFARYRSRAVAQRTTAATAACGRHQSGVEC